MFLWGLLRAGRACRGTRWRNKRSWSSTARLGCCSCLASSVPFQLGTEPPLVSFPTHQVRAATLSSSL